MRLLDEEEIQRNRLKNQKKKKSLIIIIILLSILSALIMAFIVYREYNPNKITTYINDQEIKNFDSILDLEPDENGKTQIYVPIKDVAEYFGYKSYNGDYTKKSEEQDKCYVIKEDSEVAMYTAKSNKMYKLNLQNNNNNYEDWELDKKVFEDSLKKYVLSFVTEEELNDYNNGHRSINEIGSIIENMYFNETITIKEGYVSVKNKIYTDSESLSQYLLFGPDVKMDTYTVKSGDSIASISEDNKMNSQEFLIANPKYKSEDAMLAVGSVVNITIINPIITLTYSVYEINENITPYTTADPIVDNTKEPSYKEPTRPGVNGITLIHSTYEVINGERSTGVEIKDRKVIREMVQEQYTIGRRTNGYYYPTSGWGYPTEYPYVITSPFQWRWGKHHDGIDISGTGYRSRIFAVAPGTVVEVGYRSTDGNYVIIEHENNIYTQYAHMYGATVVEGQTVKKGDQIGEMGNTGYVLPAPSKYNPTAGTHLHFGVSIGWPFHGAYSFQNPTRYIRF